MITKYKLFENIHIDLRNSIINQYKHNGIDFSDSIELDWDDKYKLYKVWVKPYNNKSLFNGKVGLSESHPKGNYNNGTITDDYDYIVLSNILKENDPYSWV